MKEIKLKNNLIELLKLAQKRGYLNDIDVKRMCDQKNSKYYIQVHNSRLFKAGNMKLNIKFIIKKRTG